jgi:hypothetical protein
MELFVLGLAVGAAGGLIAGKGKKLVKAAAKGYLVISDGAKSVGANLREDFRDAVEEARYEREQEMLLEEHEEREEERNGQEAEEAKPTRRTRRRTTAPKSEESPSPT